jgi:predicted DNA-binding transcriptional regulator AlpA
MPAEPPALPSPELLGRQEAADFCGVSRSAWERYSAAGRIPRPIRLAGRVLWRRTELLAWTAAGCPGRKVWEATRGKEWRN